MISPESYYEMHLKGKSEKEIRTAIRGLKNEIGRLKNIAEHPEYQCMIHPSESVQIWCTRLYLEEAKKALSEIGGEYKPSQAELKAQEFEDNIPNIAEIEFCIGGYFGGYPTYRVDLTGDEIKVLYTPAFADEANSEDYFIGEDEELYTKDYFLDLFKDLHIGEWRNRYTLDRFGYAVLDGTQWYLIIKYKDGKRSRRFYGDNSYPYNFDRLCDLFGIENDE